MLTVVKAQERSSVLLNQRDLVGGNGALQVLTVAQDRGLINFKITTKGLEVSVNGVVGLLPINEHLSLDIKPKFSLSNLDRMVAVSEESLRMVSDAERRYQVAKLETYSLEALIKSLAHYTGQLLQQGLQKTYVRSEGTNIPRPRINFGKSQKQFWSCQRFNQAVVITFDISTESRLNSLIRDACEVSFRFAKRDSKLACVLPVLRLALEALSNNKRISKLESKQAYFGDLEKIPSFRTAYQHAVPLAFELMRRSSVLHDSLLGASTMPSFLINLERVFEAYIRNSLLSQGCPVRDGNEKRWQKPLLIGDTKYFVKPDIVYLEKGSTPIICDIKYKKKPKEEDRYQIISHALSYFADFAILVYPSSDGASGLKYLGKTGNNGCEVKLYNYFFNLDGDLEHEEAQIATALRNLLRFHSAPTLSLA